MFFLRTLKRFLKWILYQFKLEIVSTNLTSKSDDPFEVLSKIFIGFDVKVIVDGGASIGSTSIRFLEEFPRSVVHSFEPYPKFYDILRKCQKTNKNIKSYPYALADCDGKNRLSINKSEGTNSLLKSDGTKDHPHNDLFYSVNTINIETKKLDNVFKDQSIDILKLDLQGGELNALKGATNLLAEKRIKSILCEVMFETTYVDQCKGTELIAYIVNQGFYIFNFYQIHFHLGQIYQADILFINNSLKEKISQNNKHVFMPFSKYLLSAN